MNDEHVARLKDGFSKWNAWREEHHVRPSLSGADLSGVDLSRSDLSGADLSGADLSGADLPRADLSRADLPRADLSRANLSYANLSGADLTRANLSGASLSGVDLSAANLVDANLSGATLFGANLYRANLYRANLSGAMLHRASLSGAALTGAEFNAAILADTVLANVDLSACIGLDKCRHLGPSSLDQRSLWRSGKTLPEIFLRGCGLPETLISYLPSLLAAGPIQFYSCFISYSTANEDFATRLHADLQARGIRCWFAPHDIQSGKHIHDQVDQAIRVYDRLLLLVSTESMESAWVATEVGKARQKEISTNRQVLFPLGIAPFAAIKAWTLFDADIGEDLAKTVRKFYVPDFSLWKTDHDAYQREFDRLVDSLKNTV